MDIINHNVLINRALEVIFDTELTIRYNLTTYKLNLSVIIYKETAKTQD